MPSCKGKDIKQSYNQSNAIVINGKAKSRLPRGVVSIFLFVGGGIRLGDRGMRLF